MAYLDFSTDPTRGYTVTPQHDAGLPRQTFSALEWSVVALARRDRLSSLAEPSRVSLALGRLFGTGIQHARLADLKLEALRRMAVLSWHQGLAVPARELETFLAAGFTTGQYETLLASISAARSRRGARA